MEVDFDLDVTEEANRAFAQESSPAPIKSSAREKSGSRTAPHSIEAEEYLLSSIMLDGADVLPRCIEEKISRDCFYLDAHGIIYDGLLQLFRAGHSTDVAYLAEHLKSRRVLDSVGGFAFLTQVSQRIPTTAQSAFFIDKVKELHILREAIKAHSAAVEEAYNYTGDLKEFLARQKDRVDRLSERGSPVIRAAVRPITDYSYPTNDDPDILLGSDDYLGRGGGLLFVSHAGAGKSSWIMDASMSWALGRPWMGLGCGGVPRKTLIIQAEDSDRYVGRIFASYAHVNKLSAAERELMAKNCVIVRLKGVAGAEFFAELKRLTDLHQPDLVVINPIYLYAEGDISRSDFAQPFLIGLDRVNKGEKWAYILIHHTGKPQAKGPNGKRVETEDWESAYMGFGSSYLTNWPRCSILLEPVSGQNGRFIIRLGKGGYNAGVTKDVPQGAGTRKEVVTRIGIRHSREKMIVDGRERPVYYWEKDDEPLPNDQDRSEGREDKYDFNDWKTVFPMRSSEGLDLNQLHRALAPNGVIKPKDFPDVLKRWVEDGLVDKISIQGKPTRWRAAV